MTPAARARIRGVFARGWHDGHLGIAGETAREVGETYPDFAADEISLYLNGVEDGARGDRFRLDDIATARGVAFERRFRRGEGNVDPGQPDGSPTVNFIPGEGY